MSDLITRWDATEVVYKALRTPAPDYKKDPFHDSMSLAISMVRQIPSAQQWIPVTERLPEELGCYLTSTEYHDVLSDFFCDGKWETAERFWYNVAAWMPLPEPYQPERGQE